MNRRIGFLVLAFSLLCGPALGAGASPGPSKPLPLPPGHEAVPYCSLSVATPAMSGASTIRAVGSAQCDVGDDRYGTIYLQQYQGFGSWGTVASARIPSSGYLSSLTYTKSVYKYNYCSSNQVFRARYVLRDWAGRSSSVTSPSATLHGSC